MRLLLLCIFLFTFTSAYADTSSIDKIFLEHGYQAVPINFIKDSDQFTVAIDFGKNTPQQFLIDTATIQTFIFQQAQKELQFKKGKQVIPILDGSGHLASYQQIIIPTMQLGNFSTDNETAYYPTRNFSKIKRVNYSGILGADFLREHFAFLDIGNKTLFLKPKDKAPTQQDLQQISFALMHDNYQKITLIETNSRYQVVDVSINHRKPISFMVDTGSARTLLSLRYAQKNNLSFKPIGYLVGAVGGKIPIYETEDVTNVTIGQISLRPKILSLIDFKYIFAGDTTVQGSLGCDWLVATHTILDMSNNVLYGTLKELYAR